MKTVDAICIEGNIGAGKSELLRRLREAGLSTQEEPVDRWRPFLQSVYNHDQGHVALQARITLDTGVVPGARIVERSPGFQLPVFAAAAAGWIDHHEQVLLEDLHRRVVEWCPRGIVYLRCQPRECMERIRRRGRTEEAGIHLHDITVLHELYEKAYEAAPEPKRALDVTGTCAADVADLVSALLRDFV